MPVGLGSTAFYLNLLLAIRKNCSALFIQQLSISVDSNNTALNYTYSHIALAAMDVESFSGERRMGTLWPVKPSHGAGYVARIDQVVSGPRFIISPNPASGSADSLLSRGAAALW